MRDSRSCWDAKLSVKTAKTQITRGIKEMEEIFKNLDKEMKTPPLNHMMIKKWKDVFLSKKDSVNTQLLGLMQHLTKYNETISNMTNSMIVLTAETAVQLVLQVEAPGVSASSSTWHS